MANNRIHLVHVPTMRAVFLGKRMGWGWYGAPDGLGPRLNRFYEALAKDSDDQDAFALAMEDGKAVPLGEWKYTDSEAATSEDWSVLAIEPAAPGMTEARAREILWEIIQPVDALGCSYPWVGWLDYSSKERASMVLDGHFTADQLEAIAWWMRNK